MKTYTTHPPTVADCLAVEPQVAELVLTRFLQNEIRKAGYGRAVLGLSGGIDSALACFLAARALGPENVLALRLPHRDSNPESLAHAGLVIEALGVQSEIVEITGMVESLRQATPGITPHRLGNVMARARMIVIFDRSMAFNGLVIGTSNKTELLLGYGTIYGDLASAINPIGDLYKTQVRHLSRALGVPAIIIDKPPSADLIPGQTDESDFGFTYEEVDQLLYLLFDERYSPEEAIEAGFAPAFVHQVRRMVQRNHYKRVMPLIPKVSDRSITHDFRYLRDWGT